MGVIYVDKCQCYGFESQDGGILDGVFYLLQEDGEEVEFFFVGFIYLLEYIVLFVLEYGCQFCCY